MLHVGKPNFFPILFPFLTLPLIDQLRVRSLFANKTLPFSSRLLIYVEEIIFCLNLTGIVFFNSYLYLLLYFFKRNTFPFLLLPHSKYQPCVCLFCQNFYDKAYNHLVVIQTIPFFVQPQLLWL